MTQRTRRPPDRPQRIALAIYHRPCPHYVRARIAGGTYFFTVTSRQRMPVLTADPVRNALRAAVQTTRLRWPFTIDAWVLLPDHLHCVWTLPGDDADFSKRWSTIRRLTTRALGRSVWQDRFWEHWIRDDRDRERHVDYIHFNPVKHGHVRRAVDWPYSTFHRDLQRGHYTRDWCDMSPDVDLE